MKLNTMRQETSARWLAPGLFGLALAGAIVTGQAQTTDYLIDQFDSDTSGSYGNQWWGTAVPAITWDDAVNKTTTMGPNNTGSGSTAWSIDWSGSNGSDQVMVVHWLGAVLDLRSYTNVSFDIIFDPTSATDGAGSFGWLEIDWVPSSDGWPSTYQNGTTFSSANTNWIHVSYPLDASANTKLQAVNGIGFKLQQKKTGYSLSGVTRFWLDNLILGVRTNAAPPPKLAIAPAKTPPGLMMVAPGGGNEYNRSVLRTINGAYSWVGNGSQPVTYSLNIASYPDSSHSTFQSVIFLVPGTANDSGIDWDAADVVEMVVQNNADGSATGSFQYKTNQAQGNSMYGGTGHLADIHCTTPVGRWSITFLNDTNVTLAGPGGVYTNCVFPDAAAIQSLFANPLSAYFGNQQNGANNAGQASVYSSFEITNTLAMVDIIDTFTNLDTTIWQPLTSAPHDIFVVDSTARYWVSWSLPDTGFTLQSSPNLAAGSWTEDPGLTNRIVTTTVGNRALITTTNLPSPDKGFFRMVK